MRRGYIIISSSKSIFTVGGLGGWDGRGGLGYSWQNYLASSALVFAYVCSVSLVLLARASSATTVRPTMHSRNNDPQDPKLQALVYDILPSTTAVFSYAIGSRKLSANEQFSVCVLVLRQ